ncbi:uncharacterized protein LOC117305805 [Asterias rubens]|uniref:uncharacterized protein LOC117305805 n=1 Tax=Asterias rubens TaxID=7604 RepID=UPI001455A908|nr:uncharacterized protein LOC117305805 [Asterias rubens]
MAENKFFPDSFNAAEEWRRLLGEDMMWGQIIPHSLPPPPTSVFQEQAEFTHVIEFEMEEDTAGEGDDDDLEGYSWQCASEILCPDDVFDEPLPSVPSPVPVALPVPSPVCLPPMSPLALPTVPATIGQHMYGHVGFYVRTVLCFIIQSNCYGCEVDHPSQRQHSCLMDDPQDQFNM